MDSQSQISHGFQQTLQIAQWALTLHKGSNSERGDPSQHTRHDQSSGHGAPHGEPPTHRLARPEAPKHANRITMAQVPIRKNNLACRTNRAIHSQGAAHLKTPQHHTQNCTGYTKQKRNRTIEATDSTPIAKKTQTPITKSDLRNPRTTRRGSPQPLKHLAQPG